MAAISLAALGGVLLVTAYRMIDPHSVRSLLRSTPADRAIFVLTMVATVAFDLIIAIEIGIVLAGCSTDEPDPASGAHEEALPDLGDRLTTEDEHRLLRERIVIYRIDGAVSLWCGTAFLDEPDINHDVQWSSLRMSGVDMLDATGRRR